MIWPFAAVTKILGSALSVSVTEAPLVTWGGSFLKNGDLHSDLLANVDLIAFIWSTISFPFWVPRSFKKLVLSWTSGRRAFVDVPSNTVRGTSVYSSKTFARCLSVSLW